MIDNSFDNKNNDEAIKGEIDWLDHVSLSNLENCSSWLKHHSAQVAPSTVTPGIHSMLPPMKKKVASVEAQYHCMRIIRKTIKFLNENQVPTDVWDQPVYAYSKEVQWHHPTIFGHGKYLCLLGDLHIEQSILGLHGDLIKGSGLDSVLAHTNLSTIGTSTIVDVNNIKRSRYCLQVAICVIYKLLKEAHADSQNNLSLFDWLEERSKISQMAHYWRLILNFQIQVLIFVRSVRNGNFLLYRETLFYFLKRFFCPI